MATEAKKPNVIEIKFGQVYDLDVSKIEVDWNWNVRSGNWKKGSTDETENDFEGLVHSIQTKGQDTPVQVVPAAPGSKHQFRLVVGFRRMAAIMQLKLPTIKAIVLDMDEVDSRENNIRENTGRSDLKGADLAFGLQELEKAYARKGKPWVQSAVAQSLGINQGYCNMLCKIMKAVRPEITATWRESPITVPIQAMNKLAEVKADDQPEAFKKLLENQVGKADGRSKTGKEQKLIQAAERVGKMLGQLVREDYIQITALEVSDKEFWKIVGVSVPDEYEEIPADMIKIANKAFSEALNPEPVKEKETGKGKGKGKNGAAATA